MNLDTVVGRKGRATQSVPDPRRHQRKCSICNHKDREAIDADFLLWRSAQEIVHQYSLGHRCLLYRHADATGLSARRKEYFRTALDSIIEQPETAPVTGNTIIRAIRAYSCLTKDGRWVEPSRRVIVERTEKSRSQRPAATKSAPKPNSKPLPDAAKHPPRAMDFLIETPGLENAPTH